MEGGLWILFTILCCTTLISWLLLSSLAKLLAITLSLGIAMASSILALLLVPYFAKLIADCKPYCPCDRPGAVCQDPRFIGGDGLMFYFHGNKDKDLCLVSDPDLHINTHFIGKAGRRGRDFTWVQAIAILFHPHHRLYIGAKRVAKWEDNMVIQLDQHDVKVPTGDGQAWRSEETGIKVQRQAEANKVKVEVEDLFKIQVRVVPITMEESRVHGYGIRENDCYAYLELNFKFGTLSEMVDGVLGQTYRPSYRSRVKMAVAMPVMGGVDRFASSHIFSSDCAVSNFRSPIMRFE